jgi:hypothetical protein
VTLAPAPCLRCTRCDDVVVEARAEGQASGREIASAVTAHLAAAHGVSSVPATRPAQPAPQRV